MRSKQITARDLADRLSEDPAYQEMLRRKAEEQEKRIREIEADSGGIIAALAKEGVCVRQLHEVLRPQFVPLSADTVDLLLQYLPTLKDPFNQEWAVRLIGATKVRYDARPLADLFDRYSSDGVRWAIGNTLSITNPVGVNDWIVQALLNCDYGSARQMLCVAVARILPEKANDLLMQVFEEMPGHAALGFAVCGGERELHFLRNELQTTKERKTWVGKEIGRAIRSIERRLNHRTGKESTSRRKRLPANPS